MSTITEQKKQGKVISFKFTACLGCENGQRIYKSTTWKPPEGLSYSKARKQAEAEAFRREQELRFAGEIPPQGEYITPFPAVPESLPEAEAVPEEETFRYFAEQVWMPLKVIGGGLRPSTVSMYGYILKVILPRLGDMRITEITGVDIMQYLQYLRDEYRSPDGRMLSEKSVKHHFNILRNMENDT